MWNVALNEFRELVRNRILSLIVLFSVVLILLSLALAAISLGQTDWIVVDFGLAMIEIFGLVSVVFVGSQILFREMEGRTIYLIFSKPISRGGFIVGKILGFAGVQAVMMVIEGLVFAALLAFTTPAMLTPFLATTLVYMYLKLLVLFSVVLFFSSFISSMGAILVSIGVYIVAHGTYEMIEIARLSKNLTLTYLATGVAVVFPNFEALNLKGFIHNPEIVTPAFLAWNGLYALVYLALIVAFTIFIFRRKTFEN